MYHKTNTFLQKLSDNTIIQLTRYFGKNEFLSRDRLIKNLMIGGNPKLIETSGAIFDDKTVKKESFLQLYGCNVFVSKIDNNYDGTDCIQIIFPKTKSGSRIFNSKLNDIRRLNQSAKSIEDIRSNFIFIPSHVVIPKAELSYLAICNQEIVSIEKNQDKVLLNGPYFFNRVSTTRRGLLGPHNKGIGALLNCIVIGSKYLSEHNMDVSSLDLSTIFHLGTQHGFLITEYERLNEKKRKFSKEIHNFVLDLNQLYDDFINRLNENIQEFRKKINIIKNKIKKSKIDFPDREAPELNKSIVVFKKTLADNVNILEKHKSNKLMPAIKKYLLPYVKSDDKTPEEVYTVYNEHIYPLLSLH